MPVLPLPNRIPESGRGAGHGTGQGEATLVHRMVRICRVIVYYMECLNNLWNAIYEMPGQFMKYGNLRNA